MVTGADRVASAEGQEGALNGFKGFSPTGQGRGLGTVLGGAAAIVEGEDPSGSMTVEGSGNAVVNGSESLGGGIGGPPDEMVARLVTAPLAVTGAHCSSCAGLSV